MRSENSSVGFGSFAALATGAPLVAFLVRFGIAAPLTLFAGDAFYYLDIARNSAGRAGFTFDGHHTTNGFHPLWQYTLSLLTWLHVLDFTHPASVLLRVFALCVLLLSLGAGLFTFFSTRLLHLRPLALLVAAPGLLWFSVAPIQNTMLSIWSFANGMESAASLAAFALALCLFQAEEASGARDVAFSLALGLAILARLDDVFFLPAIGAWALIAARFPLARVLRLMAPAALLIAVYCLYNRVTVGVFLPLSGAAKAGLAVELNLSWAAKLFVPMFTRNLPLSISPASPAAANIAKSLRAFQMVVPAILCAVHLFLRRHRFRDFKLLDALCAGVLLKAAYNFFFVVAYAQGLWYYTVSVIISSLVLVVWIDGLFFKIRAERRCPPAWYAFYALLVLFSFSAVYANLATVPSNAWNRLVTHGREIGQRIEAGGDHCFLEMDDGVLNYALGIPSESGFGLALDAEATRARKQGTFFSLLDQRHCTLVLSQQYSPQLTEYVQAQHWKSGESFWGVSPVEFAHYDLVPLADAAGPDVAAFRLVRRDDSH